MTVRAPVRVSFGGGGTDLPVYYRQHGGFVLSATLDRYSYVAVRPNREPGIMVRSIDYGMQIGIPQDGIVPANEPLRLPKAAIGWLVDRIGPLDRAHLQLTLRSDVPPGTGLGSSSAMAVALVMALTRLAGISLDAGPLAEAACDVEINRLGLPIGKQDQYAAAYGGLNAIEFTDEVRVNRVNLSPSVLHELERRLLLFSTGRTRSSAMVLSEQRREAERSGPVIRSLHRIKELGRQMHGALLTAELEAFGELLHEAWTVKRGLSDKVSSSDIDDWYSTARRAGAVGGKLTGAGAGGHLLLFARPDAVEAVRQAMRTQKLAEVPVRFTTGGPQILTGPSSRSPLMEIGFEGGFPAVGTLDLPHADGEVTAGSDSYRNRTASRRSAHG